MEIWTERIVVHGIYSALARRLMIACTFLSGKCCFEDNNNNNYWTTAITTSTTPATSTTSILLLRLLTIIMITRHLYSTRIHSYFKWRHSKFGWKELIDLGNCWSDDGYVIEWKLHEMLLESNTRGLILHSVNCLQMGTKIIEFKLLIVIFILLPAVSLFNYYDEFSLKKFVWLCSKKNFWSSFLKISVESFLWWFCLLFVFLGEDARLG